VVANALDAGCLVDHIGDAITFTDGFGGAFGYTCTAGDAFFKNFHGHGYFSNRDMLDYKLTDAEKRVK
jgi:hypothetical protein